MKREIQAFGEKLQKGGVGLFYYAGHGIQVNGHNYLLPVGAAIEHEKQVEYEAVDMGAVLSEMDYAHNRMNIVIMDACRDNPFARSFRSISQGLASIDAPTGTLIAYATAPGSVANDGPGRKRRLYGRTHQGHGSAGAQDRRRLQTGALGGARGHRGQTGAMGIFLPGRRFLLHLPTAAVSRADSLDSAEACSSGTHRSAPPPDRLEESAPRGEKPIRAVKTWKEPVTGLVFVWVPGGCFLMGSPQSEKDRSEDEGPVHEVCIDGFWMSKTVVTNAQFRQFQKDHDSTDYAGHSLNGDSQPAVYRELGTTPITFRNGSPARTADNTISGCQPKRSGNMRAGPVPTPPGIGARTASRACIYENVADYTAERQLGIKPVHECDDGYAATAPGRYFPAKRFRSVRYAGQRAGMVLGRLWRGFICAPR